MVTLHLAEGPCSVPLNAGKRARAAHKGHAHTLLPLEMFF